MQFRERRRVIQVIRTVYDPGLGRGRSLVLGTLDKETPVVGDDLRAACTPAELAAVADYLARRAGATPGSSPTLPESMRAAAAYFRTHRDQDALALAADIRTAWDELKEAMRDAGFSKARVKRVVKAKKAVTA